MFPGQRNLADPPTFHSCCFVQPPHQATRNFSIFVRQIKIDVNHIDIFVNQCTLHLWQTHTHTMHTQSIGCALCVTLCIALSITKAAQKLPRCFWPTCVSSKTARFSKKFVFQSIISNNCQSGSDLESPPTAFFFANVP